jgi:hypothetical protein
MRITLWCEYCIANKYLKQVNILFSQPITIMKEAQTNYHFSWNVREERKRKLNWWCEVFSVFTHSFIHSFRVLGSRIYSTFFHHHYFNCIVNILTPHVPYRLLFESDSPTLHILLHNTICENHIIYEWSSSVFTHAH